MRRLALAPLALALAAAPAAAQDKPDAVALTVYSTAAPGAVPADQYRPVPGQGEYGPGRMPVPGYAVVKQERQISLDQSQSTVRFSDVAALIDPTTVMFESLTDPTGTNVIEQNYQFDLVSQAKLMERYVDQQVTVERLVDGKLETVSGKLLSFAPGNIVLQGADGGVQTIAGYAGVRFPQLPGGLISKPTLVWDVFTKKPGPQKARVTYQTSGITWWADYNLVFAEGKDANTGTLDVNAWVSILNQSGATYPDAGLKLVAGDVQRSEPPQPMYAGKAMRMEMAAAAPPGFAEKSFFEYHLYTLGRKTTLPDNSTKQIELFPAVGKVPAEKVLVYYGTPSFHGFFPDPVVDRNLGTESNKKVDVYLRFRNAKDSGLGVPLPSGRVRVNKLDPADQSLEFIGEDTIDHTPKDEEVLIKLGNAFDVVGERKQTDFKVDTWGHSLEESIEITVRNHKDEAVKVLVKENLYRWLNWKIVKSTPAKFDKVDARTIEFPLEIAKDGEAKVAYTVRYSW